jgi:uncharacterized protein YegL
MRRLLLPALLFLVVLLLTPALAGDDVLKTYKSRFKKDAFLSEREAVLDELAEVGKVKALAALLFCMDVSRKEMGVLLKEADKLRDKLVPVTAKYQEKYRKYAEQQAKQGNPNPKTHPAWPVALELKKLEADVEYAEKRAAEWRGLIGLARERHGQLIAGLPDEDQETIRAKWEKGPLADRDWSVRADQWDLVGGVPTEWAFTMLENAIAAEPDPRVLVRVVDGFVGREATRITPVLIGLLSDVRWVIRAAAVAALEKTPSKEGVDALVARMEAEDGRIIDDCARALATLTGQKFGTNVVPWRNWWTANREAWTGPPEPPEKKDGAGEDDDKPDPDADLVEAEDKGESQTGFFGIDTRSKRLVYVIDVSGSMNEKMAEKGEATRADKAKEELKRSVLGLEDGATFNIVFFSADVRMWRKEMVTADVESRREAVEYIDKVAVVGGTATYDALKAAFDLGDVGKGKKRGADPDGDARVDTIILLSDGRPSIGHTTNPDQIRADVVEWNETRRIAVHTVAFGKDADVGFMAGLATDTGGTHVAK